MLKPVSAKTLILDGKNGKFELFEDLIHTMPKMQTEMIEARKMNHFHAHLRKEAQQKIRNINATNRKVLMTCLLYFNGNMSNRNHKLRLNIKGTNSTLIPIQNR